MGIEFDMSVLQQLRAAIDSPDANEGVFATLQAGPAREVRLAVLAGRKHEWMSALSTFESFCATVCGRRFTIEQDDVQRPGGRAIRSTCSAGASTC